MSSSTLRVAGYRFRATLGRRWRSYLALSLLIGLVGGTAMASVSAARRTQSSFPAFLRSTNPSDLTVSSYGINGGSDNGFSPAVERAIARLPHVRGVRSWVGVLGAPLRRDGTPDLRFGDTVNEAGSVDGLYFEQDRVTAVEGRLADPTRPDEVVTTARGAQRAHTRVGGVIPMGFFGLPQAQLPGFGTNKVPPQVRMDMHLVGIVEFNDQVIQDDADRLPTNMVFTPALTRRLIAGNGTQGIWYGLQLTHGHRDVPAVEREISRLLPAENAVFFRVSSLAEAKVERAVKPESIALAGFGAIAAVASLLIAVQAIARELREGDLDRQVLRALGAPAGVAALDGSIGVGAALAVGILLAAVVTVSLSPLSPFGPVRRVDPSIGIHADWTVLAAGVLVLVVALGAVTTALAVRGTPHRAATRADLRHIRRSLATEAAAASGLPTPAVLGVRFALDRGQGSTATPVLSALSGTAIAAALVVATVTFGSSLRTLVTHPPLYGWNWSYALNSVNDVPPQALTALDHDPKVAGWSGAVDVDLQIDGQDVAALVGDAHAEVAPPIVRGHAVDNGKQVVLGAATLADLHKHVGDTVTVTYGLPRNAPFYLPPTKVLIAGVATLPAVAGSATLADHVTMGAGALFSSQIEPPALQRATTDVDPTLAGPDLVFVRLRDGVSAAAGLSDMRRVARIADAAFNADPAGLGDSVNVLPVERPAEIVNYRSTGATPVVLAAGLAVGAVVALGLTLTASVRRRRRDLAVFKTIGFTRRQVAATVAWQSSVATTIGLAVGIPLGVVLGRQLWILFARDIYVVPRPTVPALSIAVVAAGAIVFANVVAALPGRLAARTPVALALRCD